MGAWDFDTFGNDTACDWGHDLEQTDDLSRIEQALAAVLDNGEKYIDSDLGSEALAACEVIARLKGNWGKKDAYTEAVDEWVKAHPQTPSPALIQRALATIDRVLKAPSELLELWAEAEGEGADWKKAVANLRSRVEG